MEYQILEVVKLADPENPGGYFLVNARDYAANFPQHAYDEGLAWHPDIWPLFVEDHEPPSVDDEEPGRRRGRPRKERTVDDDAT